MGFIENNPYISTHGNLGPAFSQMGKKPTFSSPGVGGYADAASTAWSLYSNIANTIKTAGQYNELIPEQALGYGGAPQYQVGQAYQEYAARDPKAVGKGLVGKSALSGASAGAAFGPWGALIGGGVGAIAGLFGRKKARKKARKAKNQKQQQLADYQGDFNQAAETYAGQRQSSAAYMQRLRDRRQSIFKYT
jgi:hypothetical protein